ncbi:MAG: tetratricopeptide repeat protein [Alphaproteobacteria bacterium]|nr:tetratricopeptide repeat protein [Alphaproteobacteria bacterium]
MPLTHFEILGPLGEGGMGVVWLARHVDTGLRVAVKVLTAEGVRRATLLRAFTNEVRTIAGLDHPSILRVFDYGQVPEGADPRLEPGSPYLVMELAEGGNLMAWSGQMPWPLLRGVLLRLLDGLAHAHARGIIHRDIKPANVLIGDFRRPDAQVWLADFGLAHVAGEAGAGGGGTPWFMAPEQSQEATEPQGPWTDLYAVGRTAALLAWGRSEDDPPLGDRPEGFRGWVAVLTQRSPWLRYRSAAEAAWALAQLGHDLLDVHQPLIADISALTTLALSTDAWWDGDPEAIEAAEQAVVVAPLDKLPIPTDWRGSSQRAPGPRALAASLDLFALRRTPLIGREEARDTLWAWLTRAIGEGRGGVALIRGARGLGVTRLAGWLGERADELGACSTLFVRMREGAQDPLGQALLGMLRCSGLGALKLSWRLRGCFGGPAWPHEALNGLVARLLGHGIGTEDALLARALATLHQRRPLLLVLDDVGADHSALGLIRDLRAATSEGRGVPVLLTDAGDLDLDLAAGVGVLPDPVVSLEPLPPSDHARLVGAMVHQPGPLSSLLLERTRGNPGFLVELLRGWVAEGVVEVAGEGLALAEGAAPELPDAIRPLRSRQLLRVVGLHRRHGRQALYLAALLGIDLSREEWEAACVAARLTLGADPLEPMLRAGMMTSTGTQLRFVDHMAREGLLQLARKEGFAQAGHRACAAALIQRHGPVDRQPAAILERCALHLSGAGQLPEALDALTRVLDLTVDRSGSAATELLMRERAQVVEALGLPPDDPARGWGALLESQRTYRNGRMTEAQAFAERGLAIARQHDLPALRVRCLRQLAWARWGQGHVDDLLAHLTRAEAEAEGYQRVRLHRDLGYASMYADRLEEAATWSVRALVGARERGQRTLEADALHLQGLVLVRMEKPDRAPALLREALRIHEILGNYLGIVRTRNDLGDTLRRLGQLDEASHCFEVALRLSTALGTLASTVVRANLGVVEADRGNDAEARRLLEDALLQLDSGAFEVVRTVVTAYLVCVLVRQGDFQDASDRLDGITEAITGVHRDEAAEQLRAAAALCEAQGQLALAARLRGRLKRA